MLSNNHELWLTIMKSNLSKINSEDLRLILNKYAGRLEDDVSQNHQTILMTACSVGNIKLAEQILKFNVNIHRKDASGKCALHYAASVGALEIFELLISKGANANCQTIGGQTPLMKAALFRQVRILEWYLNNSPNSFNIGNSTGDTPLQVLKNLDKQLHMMVKNALQTV